MKILTQHYINNNDKYNNNTLNKTNKENVNIVNSRIDENNYTTSKKSVSTKIKKKNTKNKIYEIFIEYVSFRWCTFRNVA